ncbi:hypothetical protein AMJ80_02375 [bacterium SM23_31]|nr:MAG: hypothetical protein AMJ80_02375 [bacterium SM23_31]
MPDWAIVTAFKSRDQVSNTLNKMARNAGIFGDKSSSAFKKASRAGTGFGNVLKGILAAGFIQRGINMISNGVRDVGNQFIGYNQAITEASAKFKGLNLETAEGQKQLAGLKDAAREAGALTEKTAGQAAAGLGFWAMAGANAAQAMTLLPGSVDIATVANKDLARTTDIASDSMGAFGLMTENTIQLEKNFTRMTDVMSKVMNSTNTDIEMMFGAIQKGAATFTAAGQKMETFQALVGKLADKGVKGGEAGTILRNMMLRLADPSKEAAEVIQNLGIQIKDQQGNFRDVIDIMADFEKATGKMGTAQKTAALSTVFGARAVTGINIIMQTGTENIRNFRTELENAAGTTKKVAATMRESLQNRIAALQSAAIEIGFQFIESFEKFAGGAITKLTEFVRAIPMREIMQDLKRLAQPISVLISTVMDLGKVIMDILKVAFQELTGTTEKNIDIVQTLADIFGFIAGVVKSFAAGLKILSPILIPIVKIYAIWTAAQWALNIAMSANPIGLIIIGIGLLIAAIGWVVTNWEKLTKGIKDGVRKIWNWFSGLLDNPFFVALGTLFAPFITVPALIVKHWEPIKKFFTDLYNNILKPIGEFFSGIGKKVEDFGKGIAEGAMGLLVKTFETGQNLGRDIRESITGEEKREAPNRTEAEGRTVNMRGRIDFSNAPEGTTAEFEMDSAPPIDIRGLGFNP